MLSGSGTAGAYQAGVLRALHEAGIKIDLVAGRGAGVIGAMFSAMDGGSRLWDDNGVWRRAVSQPLLSVARAHSASPAGPSRLRGVVLALPIALLFIAMVIALVGMLLTFVGLESAGVSANAAYSRWIETLFAPGAVPTYVPRFAVLALLIAVASRGRERRGIGVLEPREASVRPRSRRSRHRRAACPRRRSSRTAAPSSGT